MSILDMAVKQMKKDIETEKTMVLKINTDLAKEQVLYFEGKKTVEGLSDVQEHVAKRFAEIKEKVNKRFDNLRTTPYQVRLVPAEDVKLVYKVDLRKHK